MREYLLQFRLSHMPLHAAEQIYLERQITFARPMVVVLAIVELLEIRAVSLGHPATLFLFGYLFVALTWALLQALGRFDSVRLPLWMDVAALGLFLPLTPSVGAFSFLFLFVCFAAGVRWDFLYAALLSGVTCVVLLLGQAAREHTDVAGFVARLGVAGGLFFAGMGLVFLGHRHRRHVIEHEFLSRLTGLLQVEKGVAEALRILLSEVAQAFDSQDAALVFRDAEMERIFLWKVHVGETGRIVPENLPLTRADGFLLDVPYASICWNAPGCAGKGFGWDRRDARPLTEVPRIPGPARQDLGLQSVLSVTLDVVGQPAGRILIGNGRRRYTPQDLRWLEGIMHHIATPMENLFLLRHLRARAIESERSRISRDIHDGILQTLLSVVIQLDVLRRKLPEAADTVAVALGALEQTVRNETDELRQMVTDLRPLRVQSADLVELMRGFAERFRNEAGVGLDLIIDAVELQLPDRVCRELFQIYREALYNVKKHAKATHVVAKLWQNESRVVLVVDDNGEGFSFAGRFTGDELDRLRLGPISIKERARTVGGVLTVESNPGHGVRLTIEVPLG
jgi:signal transduction histidine kinase